jgi:hypothetical protein
MELYCLRKEVAMRSMCLLTTLSVALVICACAGAYAQYDIPYSVVAGGGGGGSGGSYSLLGTVGQPAIGVVSGPSYMNEIGFWYLPDWMLTGTEQGDLLPTTYWMGQNQPNPFNPVTTIRFALPQQSRVEIKLYDVAGREVSTIVDEELPEGYHDVVVNGSGLASGIYFYRIVANDFTDLKKLVLLK